MRVSVLPSRVFHTVVVVTLLLGSTLCAGRAMSQVAQSQTKPAQTQAGRSPSETVREFYKALRERRFREAFALSIYKSAIEGLKPQELEDLQPDFEKMATAITERMPANVEVSGETISGDLATVFVKVLDADGKEKMEPAGLFLLDGSWIVGDREGFEIVKKAGKKFFFNARIDAHHDDVQDMLTRISLALLLYSQQHDGKFADLPTLIAAGMLPKDLEGTESTGYRFQITVPPDFKTWTAQAEPAQYGRTGKLSFFMDAAGVRSGDTGGKPLTPPKNP
ncbi:MAG TPA: hypothetical protein VGO56_16200 [Pyrinomonadaceae bacterium]|jgi:hypothetical protein|nr:hypothetical protein [Pyrinomonadaceae bacterium]